MVSCISSQLFFQYSALSRNSEFILRKSSKIELDVPSGSEKQSSINHKDSEDQISDTVREIVSICWKIKPWEWPKVINSCFDINIVSKL